MLILYLLPIQFVQSNGDLTCLFRTYSTCIGRFGSDPYFCTDAPQLTECLKEKSPTCEVANVKMLLGSSENLGMQDNCHSELFFNKACFYNVTISDTFQSCFEDVENAINKSRETGNNETQNMPIIDFDCRYNDSNCSERTVALVCGNGTNDVYFKTLPPKQDYIQQICETNGAVDIRFSWVSFLLPFTSVLLFLTLNCLIFSRVLCYK